MGPWPQSNSEPHAGLGDPGPVRPHPARPERRLRAPDRPAGRALARGIRGEGVEDAQALVHDVRPDPATRALHELLDLVAVPVDEHRPAHPGVGVGALVSGGDVASHGLGIAAGELGCGMGAAGEVERFEDLHDLPVRLLHDPSGTGDGRCVSEHRKGRPPGGSQGWTGLRLRRSAVRPPGDQQSVSEEVPVRLRGGWHVRCHAVENARPGHRGVGPPRPGLPDE